MESKESKFGKNQWPVSSESAGVTAGGGNLVVTLSAWLVTHLPGKLRLYRLR